MLCIEPVFVAVLLEALGEIVSDNIEVDTPDVGCQSAHPCLTVIPRRERSLLLK